MGKNITKIAFAAVLFLSFVRAEAQNPILLGKAYNSDPQARVWTVDGEERLFIYGSKDENPAYYCSGKYDVFSTNDMIHWSGREAFS